MVERRLGRGPDLKLTRQQKGRLGEEAPVNGRESTIIGSLDRTGVAVAVRLTSLLPTRA